MTMLSRVAERLYWMARYLERAEHTARLIDVNLDLMADRSQETVNQAWEKVYLGLGLPLPEQMAEAFRGHPEALRNTLEVAEKCSALELALGKPMLMLFGPGFDAGYPFLFVLVAGVLARAAVGPAESLLTMSGNQNICALVYAATLAINVVLNMVLIPVLGLWGAAVATAIAMVFEAAALSFTVWRKLGIVMAVFAPAPDSRKAL